MKKSQEVFESHIKTINTPDLSKVLEIDVNNATFAISYRTYTGQAEILNFIKTFFQILQVLSLKLSHKKSMEILCISSGGGE